MSPPTWDQVLRVLRAVIKRKLEERKNEVKERLRTQYGREPSSGLLQTIEAFSSREWLIPLRFSEIERAVLDEELRRHSGTKGPEKREKYRAKRATHLGLKSLLKMELVTRSSDGLYYVTEQSMVRSYLLIRARELEQRAINLIEWSRTPTEVGTPKGTPPAIEVERYRAQELVADWFEETMKGLAQMKQGGYSFPYVKRYGVIRYEGDRTHCDHPDRPEEPLTWEEYGRILKKLECRNAKHASRHKSELRVRK
jgi:hypothetical protein